MLMKQSKNCHHSTKLTGHCVYIRVTHQLSFKASSLPVSIPPPQFFFSNIVKNDDKNILERIGDNTDNRLII